MRISVYRLKAETIIKYANSNYSYECIRAAYHKDCPIELLEYLSTRKNKIVRKAVVANVNCPEDLQFETLNNPDMADIVRKLGYLSKSVLLRLENSNHSSVRFAALSNSNHPEWQRTLEADLPASPWFQSALKKAPPEVSAALEADNILYFGGKDANKTVLSKRSLGRILALSDGVQVTPDRIARVSKNEDWLLRMAVARNLGTPPNILARLTKDAHSLVAAQAAVTQQRLSGELVSPSSGWDRSAIIIEIAARIRSSGTGLIEVDDPVWGGSLSADVHWRPELAQELVEGWTEEHWQQFGQWCDTLGEYYLLKYMNCDATLRFLWARYRKKVRFRKMLLPSEIVLPEWLIELLAKDRSEEVRRDVAKNPNCPVDLLEVLAKDKESWIRRSVAENPNCSVAVLEALAKDKESWIRRTVAKNPNCPVELCISLLGPLAKKEVDVRISVAEHPNCPVELLEVLAKDKNLWVRSSVARNPNCAVELLEALAKDEIWQVLSSVAENPNCPVELLEALAKDEVVRRSVARNPNCPVDLLEVLTRDADSNVSSAASYALSKRQ